MGKVTADRTGAALALRPECSNPGHGFMELRDLGRGTKEQDWCGRWYDCTRCTSSTLLPSPALTAQLAEQRTALEAATAAPRLFDLAGSAS